MSRPRPAPACSIAILHESLDELAEFNLARHRLRSLDNCPDIQLLDGRAEGGGGRRCRFLAQLRVQLLKLPHLAQRAPAEIAVPCVPQIGVGNRLEAARRVEPRSHLMGQALVLYKTIPASRLNGLLVQAHCIGLSPFEAGDLGQDECVLVGESRWIVVGPFVQALPVHRQEVAPHTLLIRRTVLISAATVSAV